MKPGAVFGATLGALLVASGCGQPRHIGDLPDGGDAGSPVDSGTTSDSGTGGDAGPSLLGTWDVTVTPTVGLPAHATVVLGTESLNITGNGLNFTVIRSGNQLLFSDVSGSTVSVAATQTAAGFFGGSIPFNMGGGWQIQSGDTPPFVCQGQVGPAQIVSDCGDAGRQPQDVLSGFTLVKTLAESSMFGDLGGKWAWSDDAGANCTVEFRDQTMSSFCINSGSDMDGAFSGQLSGNTFSGTAPNSVEFSATKR
jgi:hypothetical protein